MSRKSQTRNRAEGLENFRGSGGLVLTIGTFDGVHLGHRLLLNVTRELAEEREIESAAYTYALPPKRYLADSGPPLIMDPESKFEMLRKFVDHLIIGNFREVRDYPPEQYVEEVLVDRLGVRAVVVGDDWRFGKNRAGSYRDLERLSRGRFTVHPQSQLKQHGRSISSTWIRQALGEGNISLVRELLGRYPSYRGKVVKGNQVGSDIGFPTANIALDSRVALPKRGSYAAFVQLEGRELQGAVHVGDRPTFGETERHQVEVHLFDFSGDIYGKDLEVRLVEFLGGTKKYRNREELREAIGVYVREAKKVLKETSPVN